MSFVRRFEKIIEQVEQRIGSASILLLALMIVGKLAGFLKLNLTARFLGTSLEADTFFVAFAIPDLVFSLLVVGTVNAALIPVFTKIQRNENKQILDETLNTVIIILIGILIICATVAYFGIPYVADALFKGQSIIGIVKLNPTLSQASNDFYKSVFINLSRMLIASPILLTVSSILGAYLQSHKKFLYTALAPVLYNVGQVVALVLFRIYAPSVGVYAFGYAVIFGSLCHLLIQIPAVLSLHPANTFIFKVNKYVREIFKLAIPRIIGMGVEQVSILFNNFWGFTLGVGALSAFNYASSVQSMPVDILSGSFLQAIFPHLNDAANKKDNHESLNSLYARALILLLLIGIPIVVLIIVLRVPIVRFTYGAGRFSWSATVATSFVLAFFAPSVLLQAIASLNIRTFYALHNTKVPLIVSIVGVVAAILSSILFTNFFSHYQEFLSITNTFSANPLGFDYLSLFSMFSWFFIRNKSFAAVAGLAFGLSFALFFEVLLSYIFLAKKTKSTDYFFKHRDSLRHVQIILTGGFAMLIAGYVSYKILDTYIFSTSYIIQLGFLALTVTIVMGLVYAFICRNVLLSFVYIRRLFNKFLLALRLHPMEINAPITVNRE